MGDKSTAAAVKKKGGMGEYFRGIKTEVKKVVWPTKKELASYTGVVLLTCAAFAVGFWVVDTIFISLLKLLLNISL